MTFINRLSRSKTLTSLLLISPLVLFLLAFYIAPIAAFLQRSTSTAEIAAVIPRTAQELALWDGEGLPSDETFAAFAAELAANDQRAAVLARRLNAIKSGMRSSVRAAAAKARTLGDMPAPEVRQQLIAASADWGAPESWQLLRRETGAFTPTFILDAIDLRRGSGGVEAKSQAEGLFVPVFLRTLAISLTVTIVCLVVGYPVAWVIAMASQKVAAWLMLLILVPLWLSILARTAAWVIVLQGNGPVNDFLQWLGVIDAPLRLIFNRFGVVLVMVHVMLPFLVLPLCNAIRSIPVSYFQAASNLGASPVRAFFHVILPLTLPGMWAGSFIVFIMCIGYYITPALVGGQGDQMVSSLIAFYTNQSVNWSLASALSAWLLGGMLVLVFMSQRIVGPRIKRVTR